ncbi:DUF2093 domain-containing protein [Hartmannibacter diazotrophicus]|nr:DUF2093 domain-containing protein [Hartmannibacter diazotrophicus]
MNRMDFPGRGGEAVIEYLDGDFHVIKPGSFVRCAITGKTILLPHDLKYWSVARQEAYVDAEASLEAEMRATNAKRR